MQIESVSISGQSSPASTLPSTPTGSTISLHASETEGEKKKAQFLDMNEMVSDIQKNLNVLHNVNLQFSVHQASGQVMVIVTDEETGKIIREIPSNELLNLTAKLEEMMGLIFDQKV